MVATVREETDDVCWSLTASWIMSVWRAILYVAGHMACCRMSVVANFGARERESPDAAGGGDDFVKRDEIKPVTEIGNAPGAERAQISFDRPLATR